MARRRRKVSKKVDLRRAYDMGNYTGDYAWFVRTKVTPIIGVNALHPIKSRSGSRVKEYSVTLKNLHRVIKALGIETSRYKNIQAVKKAVAKAGPEAAAEMIVRLVEQTEQPKATKKFPISYRIPLHPISHNMLYKAAGGRMVKTDDYKNWRKSFFPLIQAIVPKTGHGVDFSKPVELRMHFGHREKSDWGGVFDMQNFQKAAIDCSFEHFGSDDSQIPKIVCTREFVNSYSEGFMEFRICNM